MKHLWLGLVLIAATSGILLISDAGQRRSSDRIPRIAIFQHASQGIVDDGVRGMEAALAEAGFVDAGLSGNGIRIRNTRRGLRRPEYPNRGPDLQSR